MGLIKGFLEYSRKEPGHRPVEERVHDFEEFNLSLTPDEIHQQAARCMDCGIPFCNGMGCPLKNAPSFCNHESRSMPNCICFYP